MFKSRIKEVGTITFPKFRATMLYMHQFDLSNPQLPIGFEDFTELFQKMLISSGLKSGIAHVTIDSRLVLKGKSHRLPGPHVDGNFNGLWGGGGWLLNNKGKQLSPEDHEKFYCSPLGGMIIASNYAACKAWDGDFDFKPGQGGDMSGFKDLDKLKSQILKSNTIYITNSTCIHESIPVDKNIKRTLMRITLPPIMVIK